MLALRDAVRMRVAAKDGLHLLMRLHDSEDTIKIKEISVVVAQRVVDEKHDRTLIRVVKKLAEPSPLILAQETGRLVYV